MQESQGGGGDDSGMDQELKAVRQVFTHAYREDRETQYDQKLGVVLRVKLEDKKYGPGQHHIYQPGRRQNTSQNTLP